METGQQGPRSTEGDGHRAEEMGGQRGAGYVGGQRGAGYVGEQGRRQDMGGQGSRQNMGAQRSGQDIGGQRSGQDIGGHWSGQDMGGQGSRQNMWAQRSGQDMGGHWSGQDMGGQRSGQDIGGQRSGQDMGGQRSGQDMGGHWSGQDIGGQRSGQDIGGQTGAAFMRGQGNTDDTGGPWTSVLVRFPNNQPKFSIKIEKYFSSKIKSGGDENCKVMEISPSEYRVCFQDRETQDRVLKRKDHKIESIAVQVTKGADMKSDELHRSHRTSRTRESVDIYTEDGRGNEYRDLDRPELPEGDDGSGSHPNNLETNFPTRARDRSSHFPEIFSEVSTRLNTDLIDGKMFEEIKRTFTTLKVIESEAGVKVTGSYRAIEELHNFLQKKLGGGVRRSAHEEECGEVDGEGCLNLPSTLYEYFTEIYKDEVTKIESRFNVKVTEVRRSKDLVYVKLKSLGKGSSVEQAKHVFTNQVQDVTKDWSQKEAPISAMKASLEDTKQYMKKHHKTLVIQDGGRLILRGPERELTQAVEALQKGEVRSLLPRRVITISSKDLRNEVLVDAKHMDFLKKLKCREIEALQQKYRVRMDEERRDRNVIITFRAVNGAPDLGAHACHSFTNLLQSTVTNLQRKTINVNLEGGAERLAEFRTRLQKGGVDVIVAYDQSSVTFIASQILVDFAEEKFREIFKIQDARGAAASGGDTDEAMDTSRLPEKKTSAEEEKCPICLDQIKNKQALPKCKHEFCDVCLKQCLDMKPVCPVCFAPYGVVIGDQPPGTMSETTSGESLPGFPKCGSIHICYNIPGGIQQKNHPNPGKPFSGTKRAAYLPDNQEGREVLCLLRKAFDQRLIFTVGDSHTTGCKDTVTWNDIHHKTSKSGGYGYPDPEYLNRVRDELKAKGIE